MAEDFRAFWAVVPATVLDDMSLQANAKILYGILSTLMRREGYCWPTNAQLAEAMHCSEDVIGRWIASLAKGGHIRVTVEPNRKTGGKIRRIYPALPEPVLEADSGGYPDKYPGTYPDKNPRVPGQKSGSLYKDGYKNKKEKEREKKETAKASAAEPVHDLFVQCAPYGEPLRRALQRFLSMRSELRKPIKSKQAATLLWHKLMTLSDGNLDHMVALLDTATEHQWLSLYQLKDDELRRLRQNAAAEAPATVDLSGLRFV